MNKEIRDFEDVRRSLLDSIETAKLEKELWSKVKVLKKKDGSDFASRAKSFKNANYGCERYSDDHHPVLTVSGRNSRGVNCSYTIWAYINVTDLPKDDPRREKADKPYYSCTIPTYLYTPDELFEQIKKRISQLDYLIVSLEKQLEMSKTLYNELVDAVKKSLECIKNQCKEFREDDKKYPCSLEYNLGYVLENNILQWLIWR